LNELYPLVASPIHLTAIHRSSRLAKLRTTLHLVRAYDDVETHMNSTDVNMMTASITSLNLIRIFLLR